MSGRCQLAAMTSWFRVTHLAKLPSGKFSLAPEVRQRWLALLLHSNDVLCWGCVQQPIAPGVNNLIWMMKE